MSRVKLLLLAFVLFTSCRVHKDVKLAELKTKTELKIDSTFIDSIKTKITGFRSTRINFDTSGKVSNVVIVEAVTEDKTAVKKVAIKKKLKAKKEEKKLEDKTVSEAINEVFSINYQGLICVLAMVAVIVYMLNRSGK